MSDDIYKVEVRGNLVQRITPVPRTEADLSVDIDDPLAVSSLLAKNNMSNGSFDGDYHLSSFGAARHFAGLCLNFQKIMCEKSYDAVQEAGTDGALSWINPYIPGSETSADE